MTVTTAALLLVATPLAQTASEHALQLENQAMNTLAYWGTGNVLAGGLGALLTDNAQLEAFHTMNASWGAVNLGLALVGKASLQRETTPTSQHERWLRLPSIFAFNAGLDVAYISAGAWLWSTGAETDNPTQEGWGQSLVLQGSALMIFDLWMAQRFNQSNRRIWLSTHPAGTAIQGHF